MASLESLLARNGAYDLDRSAGPTGYFSTGLDRTVRAFQHRHGLRVDGVLEPEGETLGALRRETGTRLGEREDRATASECADIAVRLANLDLQLQEARDQLGTALRNLDEVKADAGSAVRRLDRQTLLEVGMTALPAARAIAVGRAVARQLRDLAGRQPFSGGEAQGAIEREVKRVQAAVDTLRREHAQLERGLAERGQLLERQRRLGCSLS